MIRGSVKTQAEKVFVNGIGQTIKVPVLTANDEKRITYLKSLTLTEETKDKVFEILPHLDRLDLAYWAQTLDKEHLLYLYEQNKWREICARVYEKGLFRAVADTVKMYRLAGYWNDDFLRYKIKQGFKKCLPF